MFTIHGRSTHLERHAPRPCVSFVGSQLAGRSTVRVVVRRSLQAVEHGARLQAVPHGGAPRAVFSLRPPAARAGVSSQINLEMHNAVCCRGAAAYSERWQPSNETTGARCALEENDACGGARGVARTLHPLGHWRPRTSTQARYPRDLRIEMPGYYGTATGDRKRLLATPLVLTRTFASYEYPLARTTAAQGPAAQDPKRCKKVAEKRWPGVCTFMGWTGGGCGYSGSPSRCAWASFAAAAAAASYTCARDAGSAETVHTTG
jgi:hypothetical protein